MIWVVIAALIVSVAFNVLMTVLVLRSSQRGMMLLDRSHARTIAYTEDLLNRVMSRDFSEYLNSMAPVPEEEDEELSPLEMVPTFGADRGGFGSRLGLTAYGPQDEIIPEEEMP